MVLLAKPCLEVISQPFTDVTQLSSSWMTGLSSLILQNNESDPFIVIDHSLSIHILPHNSIMRWIEWLIDDPKSFDQMDPSKLVLCPSLLNIQNLHPNLTGNLANLKLLVIRNRIINSIVLDVLDSAYDHRCAWAKAFQQFSLLLAGDHLIDRYLSLRNPITIFTP